MGSMNNTIQGSFIGVKFHSQAHTSLHQTTKHLIDFSPSYKFHQDIISDKKIFDMFIDQANLH